jgi:hypothetical protein
MSFYVKDLFPVSPAHGLHQANGLTFRDKAETGITLKS